LLLDYHEGNESGNDKNGENNQKNLFHVQSCSPVIPDFSLRICCRIGSPLMVSPDFGRSAGMIRSLIRSWRRPGHIDEFAAIGLVYSETRGWRPDICLFDASSARKVSDWTDGSESKTPRKA
jgi:hypothetical protein